MLVGLLLGELMRRFAFTEDSLFKNKNAQSADLPDSEKIAVPKGTVFGVDDVVGEEDGHFIMKPTFYVYKGHLKEITETPKNTDYPDTKEGHIARIIAECKKFKCTLPQAAYILATTQHETASTFKPVREAFWQTEAWRAKNLRYYVFYGRGYVQLTWKSNYSKYQALLNRPLVNNPDMVMEPAIAAFILVHGSMNGTFTGVGLPKYINRNAKDYHNARRVINGTDAAAKIARLAVSWERQLLQRGY